jgi:hypothetical protein
MLRKLFIKLLKKLEKPKNNLVIQSNNVVTLGCPCSTQADGSCTNQCRKVNTESHPCISCPISSMVYISIAIREEMKRNNMVALNMCRPIVLSLDMFPGKEV